MPLAEAKACPPLIGPHSRAVEIGGNWGECLELIGWYDAELGGRRDGLASFWLGNSCDSPFRLTSSNCAACTHLDGGLRDLRCEICSEDGVTIDANDRPQIALPPGSTVVTWVAVASTSDGGTEGSGEGPDAGEDAGEASQDGGGLARSGTVELRVTLENDAEGAGPCPPWAGGGCGCSAGTGGSFVTFALLSVVAAIRRRRSRSW